MSTDKLIDFAYTRFIIVLFESEIAKRTLCLYLLNPFIQFS